MVLGEGAHLGTGMLVIWSSQVVSAGGSDGKPSPRGAREDFSCIFQVRMAVSDIMWGRRTTRGQSMSSMSSMSCSMSFYVSLGLNCGPSHPNKDLSSHKDGPAECFGCVIQQQEAAGVDATPGVLVGM